MKPPFVSVVIPIKAVSSYLIKENLPSFKKQAYRKFEVIVLPNSASRNTKVLMKQYPWLRIIPTHRVTRPAEKRDSGVQHAKGEIIAFIDDDAYPASTWLKTAVPLFKDKKIVAVCGPGILPPSTTFLERVFDEVLTSWVGSGGYAYRFVPQKKRFVDDYPSMNFLVRKKEFLTVGGFNSEYWPGEDSKLCEDLVYKRGGKILYSPRIVTYHHRRDNLFEFLKQHANYGFHRGAFFAHGDRNSMRFSYCIPTFFVFYLFFLILNTKYLILYTPLLIYLLFMLYLFFRAFKNTKSLRVASATPFVLFFTHVTYGILFVKGFITGVFKKQNIY